MSQTSSKGSVFDKLPSLIKKSNVTLFPEGAIGYLVGPTLALMANSVLANYFNKYMTDVLNINSWASEFFKWLPVISVIFVVLGNIIVGRLMDKSSSRAGKARPLLLISVPISFLALLILFVISPLATDTINPQGQSMALVCIAIGYNLWFAIAYPMYYTPHAALVNLSTRNSKDRTLLATLSNATALAAMGLSTMILPFFLSLLFVPQTTNLPEGAVLLESGEYALNGVVLYDAVASYNHWKIFVIALTAITVVGALVEFMFTRERVTEESMDQGENAAPAKALPIAQQAKICFSDKFWVIMMVFFFCYQLGGMAKNVSQLYFCQAMFPAGVENGQNVYSISNGGSISGFLAIIGAIPTAIGMVAAPLLANKIGKGKAIFCGAVLATVGGLLGMIAPSNLVLVYVSFILKALGSTPAMYLSMALLADVLDHQEAIHGKRTDGLTMTIYGAIMAGMTGVATGILNIVLSNVGYAADNISSEAIRAAMPWVFIGVETFCYLIIFLTFIFMGVEKFGKYDHEAIVADQKAAAEKEGRAYISAEEKIRLEEGEEAYQAELKKQADVKAAEEKKLAALSAEARKALADKEEAIRKEFNAMRSANGRTAL
ncbi:MAG: MFS transporter [Clostridia bacterium]|nr:MFS transporter [Clostridia bacterium]